MNRQNAIFRQAINCTICVILFTKLHRLYVHILPTVHQRGRTQECSKALVVLLSFYWIKVLQLRYIFAFYQ